MSNDYASLSLKIDSSQAKTATENLNGLTQASQKTESATQTFINTLDKQIKTYGMTSNEIRRYEASLLSATAAQRLHIDSLLKQNEEQEALAARVATVVKGIGALATGAIAGAGALFMMANKAISAADAMNDLHLKTGLSFQDLAAYELMAAQSGTTTEQVANGFKFLGKEITLHGDKMRALGVTSKDNSTAMGQFADIISNIKDPMLASALAMSVLGRSGTELIPMLKGGSAAMEQARKDTEKYGVLLTDLAPRADAYKDSVALLAIHSKETGINIANYFLPGLIGLVSLLNDAAAGGDKMKRAFDWMSEKSPMFAALVKWHYFLEKIAALNGGGDKLGKQSVSGDIRGGAADLAAQAKAEEELGAKNEATIAATAAAEAFLAKKEAADKYLKVLESLEQRVKNYGEQVKQQMDTEKKLTEGDKIAILVKEKLAEADQKRLAPMLAIIKANEAAVKVQQEKEKLDKLQEAGLIKIKAHEEQAASANRNKVKAMQEELDAYGEDARAKERRTTLLKFENDAEKHAIQIRKDAAQSKQADGGETAANRVIDDAKKSAEAWVTLYDKLIAKQYEWQNGAIGGMKKYAEDVGNIAKDVEQLFTRAFKGMEDAMVNFIMTGKLDFKSFANSILSDMARIAVRQNITGPLASLGGDMMKSLFRPTANALGGAYDSPDLNQYQNTILSSPTLFRFAQGGAFGLAGEAGPEAIMPLSRGPDGKLGVQSSGGNSAPSVVVNVINQSGQKLDAKKQGAPQFNGEEWVLGVVVSAASSNPQFRSAMGIGR